MRFKHVCRELHKWLGVVSGVVVFIVCVTGCLYVFKDEIEEMAEPWRFVVPREAPVLMPSRVLEVANKEAESNSPSAITYGEAHDALVVDYYGKSYRVSKVYIDPYTGAVIKSICRNPGDFDFFRFILNGHRQLWLPAWIGKRLVGWSVLVFVIILITGIVLWFPKRWNKKSCERLFLITWSAGKKRLNFDLHKVLGGYFALILLLLSLTGMVWNMEWFGKSVYRLTGGKELKPYVLPLSDTAAVNLSAYFPVDKLFIRLKQEEPAVKEFYMVIPQKPEDVCRVSIVHKRNSYYRTDNRFFDQYSLEELTGQGPYAGKYKEASAADKIRRMNLELHDGRIAGLPGKIIVFLAALAGASLPVTGWIIWGRKRKKECYRANKRNR